jgi:hypothetical protein
MNYLFTYAKWEILTNSELRNSYKNRLFNEVGYNRPLVLSYDTQPPTNPRLLRLNLISTDIQNIKQDVY